MKEIFVAVFLLGFLVCILGLIAYLKSPYRHERIYGARLSIFGAVLMFLSSFIPL